MPEIQNIQSQTLIISGRNEGADQASMEIWTSRLPKCAGHIQFEHSTHMPHLEEREKFIEQLF